MKDIDDIIRKAIMEEDAELARRIPAEPGIFDLMADMFKGRMRGLHVLGFVMTLVFLALAVLALVRFFRAEEIREMIAWAMGFMFCLSAVTAIKIWFWLELQRVSLAREIKRVEFEIAVLAGRLRDGRSQ